MYLNHIKKQSSFDIKKSNKLDHSENTSMLSFIDGNPLNFKWKDVNYSQNVEEIDRLLKLEEKNKKAQTLKRLNPFVSSNSHSTSDPYTFENKSSIVGQSFLPFNQSTHVNRSNISRKSKKRKRFEDYELSKFKEEVERNSNRTGKASSRTTSTIHFNQPSSIILTSSSNNIQNNFHNNLNMINASNSSSVSQTNSASSASRSSIHSRFTNEPQRSNRIIMTYKRPVGSGDLYDSTAYQNVLTEIRRNKEKNHE